MARKQILDSRALGFGALIALGAGVTGVAAALGHYALVGGGTAEQGAEAIFVELLLFLGLLGIGLPVAAFISVWRGSGAFAVTQGSAAILLGAAAGFGPAALASLLIPGGLPEVLDLLGPLSPIYLFAQAVGVVAAGIANRIRARRTR